MQYAYLKTIEYLTSYKIKCFFEDGNSGILDLSIYLNRGGVFDKLKDECYARKMMITNGVLTWGNGELDIAPETIYHLATHSPLPDWMREEY